MSARVWSGTAAAGRDEPGLGAPILVAGSDQRWDCWLCLVGGLGLLLAGVACWAREPPLGVALVIGGVVFVLIGMGVWMSRSWARRWVRVAADGFDWLERLDGDPQRHFDRDVLCMSVRSRKNYVNGVYSSTSQWFTVWVEEPHGTRRIVMTTKWKQGQVDPLSALVGRIARRLHDEAVAALDAGHRVEGKGWNLEQDVLRVSAGRGEVAIPFSEVTAVEPFDGHVCVWRRGEEAPAARVVETSENAPVLMSVLRERIAAAPDDAAEGGLGRILFERRTSWGWTVTGLMFSGLLLVAGALALIGALLKGAVEVVLVSLFLLGFGGTLLFLTIWARTRRFSCHLRGVRQKSMFGERTLRFDELDAFTLAAVRIYVKGAYAGTQVTLTFEPPAASGARKIKYAARVQNVDESLELLREHASNVIAGRMFSTWASGQSVVWLPHLTFFPAGARYRPPGFLGRKAEVFLPYAGMDRWQLDDGKFQLWMRGEKKPIVSENTIQRNFFPGLTLLFTILRNPPATPAPEARAND